MLQNGASLLGRDAGEPFDELMERRVVFEILEQGRNRYPRAAKYPGAAYPSWVMLGYRTGRPIDHAAMVALGGFRAA